jgi:hypothetical protein
MLYVSLWEDGITPTTTSSEYISNLILYSLTVFDFPKNEYSPFLAFDVSSDDDICCLLTPASGCKTVEDAIDDKDVDAAVDVPPEEKKDDIDLCLLCGCALRVDASFINSNLLLLSMV